MPFETGGEGGETIILQCRAREFTTEGAVPGYTNNNNNLLLSTSKSFFFFFS